METTAEPSYRMDPMVHVILIRHGETDWNKEQIFRGKIDVSLNELGLAQARGVKESLDQVAIDTVYASPLARAFATAQMLAEARNLTVGVEEGFSDIDFGAWQGLSHQKVREEYGDLYAAWRKEPHRVTFPQGESLLTVQMRSIAALERCIAKNPGKTIAIVSHRVINKVILCSVLGLELSRFWHLKQDTCAINRFEYKEGGYFITLLNDTCHLRGVADEAAADF